MAEQQTDAATKPDETTPADTGQADYGSAGQDAGGEAPPPADEPDFGTE